MEANLEWTAERHMLSSSALRDGLSEATKNCPRRSDPPQSPSPDLWTIQLNILRNPTLRSRRALWNLRIIWILYNISCLESFKLKKRTNLAQKSQLGWAPVVRGLLSYFIIFQVRFQLHFFFLLSTLSATAQFSFDWSQMSVIRNLRQHYKKDGTCRVKRK